MFITAWLFFLPRCGGFQAAIEVGFLMVQRE